MPPTKKITLKRSDGETFDVDEAVALQSQTIKRMLEGDRADNGIPLSNVTGKILAKVIEDCKKMIGPRRAWDAEFVKVDQAVLPILCFSTGVKQLQFKQQSTYEFRYKVVNFGGHSPEDVSAALSSLDKKIMTNRKEIMKRYQLFLANFEGKNLCMRKKDSRNQMNFADPSTALLPASGGDYVKLFDVSKDTGSDLCMLSYSPSPGFHVNSVKWNHTSKFSHTHPRSSPAALQPGIESWLFM